MRGFCEKKFTSMLISGTVITAVMYLMLLSDSIIAGYYRRFGRRRDQCDHTVDRRCHLLRRSGVDRCRGRFHKGDRGDAEAAGG